ncbi:MAG: helix-turn-helix domain-containing protein [Gammaproteobacteria bacterium]
MNIEILRKACSECSLQELCLPLGISAQDLETLDGIVDTIGPLHRGEHLFRQGEIFQSLYSIRSGCVKSYADSENGEEQVLGFHLPGELIGMDAIYRGAHQCSAEILDTTLICRLPFAELSDLARQLPSLQRQLFRLMSQTLETSQILSSQHSAEERLAAFLLDFGDRIQARGFSSNHFILPMSRQDIASYLRLVPETVSRALNHLAGESLIEITRRDIRLKNRPELERRCPRDSRL